MVGHWRRADLDADGLDESRNKREEPRMASGFPSSICEMNWPSTEMVQGRGSRKFSVTMETLDRKQGRAAVWLKLFPACGQCGDGVKPRD